MIGLQEHLFGMFREDFEFHHEAAPSHLGHAAAMEAEPAPAIDTAVPGLAVELPGQMVWSDDGDKELKKIPFFVRGKAKRNTERFAEINGIRHITVETLYDAKAHFSR